MSYLLVPLIKIFVLFVTDLLLESSLNMFNETITNYKYLIQGVPKNMGI